MTRLLISICVALALSLCLAAVSSAHKVNIFAYVDGDTVVTDSGYSRSQRVHGGLVEVYDAVTGKQLLAGTTDDDGKFSFAIPEDARETKSDLRLLLKAGEGHQAEWLVRYSEYSQAVDVPDFPVVQTGSVVVDTSAAVPAYGNDELQAMVKATVHSELAPVKRMLADLNQSGPGMTEIFGGIGYILGLFGVVAYMKGRKNT